MLARDCAFRVAPSDANTGMLPPAMIRLEGVRKSFAGKEGLCATTLRVEKRARLALVGPSGCGKSTVLRLVVGLSRPDAGRVLIDGTPMEADTCLELRQRMGYVIQEGGLFPHLTARENITLMARHLGWSASRLESRVRELSALVRLPDAAVSRYPAELSGGQRQRVSLMRALMLAPEALLLDEPFGSLDPVVRAALQDDLLAIFETVGTTVLLVTHDLSEAAYLAHEIAFMQEGRILQRGSFATLRDAPADPSVSAFLQAHRPLPLGARA